MAGNPGTLLLATASDRISLLSRPPSRRQWTSHGLTNNWPTAFADGGPLGVGKSFRGSPPSPKIPSETCPDPIANLLGTPNRSPATSSVSESPHSGPLRDRSEPESAGAGGRSEPKVKTVYVPTGLEIVSHPVAAPARRQVSLTLSGRIRSKNGVEAAGNIPPMALK